jgi:hypothetical protein
MCARGERLTAVNCPDGHNDSKITDLEVTDTMLHRNRQDIVLISGLFCTFGQHIQCAGMLGVVERDNVGAVVRVAHGPDEQRDATNGRVRDHAKRLLDIEWRLADADLTNLRWHASTLVRALTSPELSSHDPFRRHTGDDRCVCEHKRQDVPNLTVGWIRAQARRRSYRGAQRRPSRALR